MSLDIAQAIPRKLELTRFISKSLRRISIRRIQWANLRMIERHQFNQLLQFLVKRWVVGLFSASMSETRWHCREMPSRAGEATCENNLRNARDSDSGGKFAGMVVVCRYAICLSTASGRGAGNIQLIQRADGFC